MMYESTRSKEVIRGCLPEKPFKTECGTVVKTATLYDADDGSPLMEDITLTSFEIEDE